MVFLSLPLRNGFPAVISRPSPSIVHYPLFFLSPFHSTGVVAWSLRSEASYAKSLPPVVVVVPRPSRLRQRCSSSCLLFSWVDLVDPPPNRAAFSPAGRSRRLLPFPYFFLDAPRFFSRPPPHPPPPPVESEYRVRQVFRWGVPNHCPFVPPPRRGKAPKILSGIRYPLVTTQSSLFQKRELAPVPFFSSRESPFRRR